MIYKFRVGFKKHKISNNALYTNLIPYIRVYNHYFYFYKNILKYLK